jgi:hypothetical protein
VEMRAHHPVDGILLVPSDSRHGYLETLASGTTPIVRIDRPRDRRDGFGRCRKQKRGSTGRRLWWMWVLLKVMNHHVRKWQEVVESRA